MGSLRFSHSIVAVKQLYFQEVMPKVDEMARMMPGSRLAERMAGNLKLQLMGVLKAFKEQGNTLRK